MIGTAKQATQPLTGFLTNITLMAQGNPRGLLASSQLDPFSTTEIQVTIETVP